MVLRREARREILDGALWYDEQRPGLGDGFRRAIREAMEQIAETPLAWPLVWRDVRRKVLTRRFPYVIYYRFKGEQVRVLAVSHTARRPGYWSSRS